MQRVQKVLGLKVFKDQILPKEIPSVEAPNTSTTAATITKHITRDDVLNAEVLWAVKTVMSYFSANSSSNTGDLFRKMFPDSQIPQRFNCGKTKCTYFITHGFAPYFHNNSLSILRESDVKYVLSFDESFNKVQQQEQVDMIIHFWDNQKNKVCSRYFESKFLGHTLLLLTVYEV